MDKCIYYSYIPLSICFLSLSFPLLSPTCSLPLYTYSNTCTCTNVHKTILERQSSNHLFKNTLTIVRDNIIFKINTSTVKKKFHATIIPRFLEFWKWSGHTKHSLCRLLIQLACSPCRDDNEARSQSFAYRSCMQCTSGSIVDYQLLVIQEGE